MDLEMAERRRDAEKNGPLLPPIPGEKKSPAQMKRERLKELDKEIRELKAEVTKLRKPVEAAGKDSAKQKQTLEDLRDDLVALWSGISP